MPKDLDAARHWFSRAAQAGDASGQHNYAALLFREGKTEEADSWMQKAVEQEHAPSVRWMQAQEAYGLASSKRYAEALPISSTTSRGRGTDSGYARAAIPRARSRRSRTLAKQLSRQRERHGAFIVETINRFDFVDDFVAVHLDGLAIASRKTCDRRCQSATRGCRVKSAAAFNWSSEDSLGFLQSTEQSAPTLPC